MKDRYGREINYLRISLTDKCNLRCVYCMPEKGICKRPHKEMLRYEDFLRVIAAFQKLGLRKLRLTGGEPLVKRDLVSFVAKIKALGVEEVTLTTNGVLLKPYAYALKQAGLSRVNISLDTLRADRYREITRVGDIKEVHEGIRAAKEAGLVPIKVNTVLIKGFNDDEVEDLLQWAAKEEIMLRFIELMPIGEAIVYRGRRVVLDWDKDPRFKRCAADDPASPAKYYQTPYGSLAGLIEPVHCRFCAFCNRLRLDCHGKLLTCLHSQEGIDLKPILQKKGDITPFLEEAIRTKPERHYLTEGIYNEERMNSIGG